MKTRHQKTGWHLYRSALGLGLILLYGVGCTDGRQPPTATYLQANSSQVAQNLYPTNYVQYRGANTDAMQMIFNNTELLFTGSPIGLMGIETGANADVPSFVFALSEHLGVDSSSSSVFPSWGTTTYASGAVATAGTLVYTSGDYGMSIFDISSPTIPQEVRRYHPPDPNTLTAIPDQAYQFEALALNPSSTIVYGFRKLDYVHVMQMTNAGLDIASEYRVNYSSTGSNVCCVNGAAVFGNKIFVAFTNKLVSMDMGPNGALGNVQTYPQFQAVNVQATASYLYVHHRANFSNPQGAANPTGIYVFSTTGQNVAYFDIDPIRFSVNPGDTRLYANQDGTKINIYQMYLSGLAP